MVLALAGDSTITRASPVFFIAFATRRFQSLRVTMPIELSSIPYLLRTFVQAVRQSHRATSAFRGHCVQYLSPATERKQINSLSQIIIWSPFAVRALHQRTCINHGQATPYNTILWRQSAASGYRYAIFTHFLPG